MHYLLSFLALDIARQRAEEATRYRLASIAAQGRPSTWSRFRRSLAQALAAVSLGSAGVVRLLDGRIADELGRSLAPTE